MELESENTKFIKHMALGLLIAVIALALAYVSDYRTDYRVVYRCSTPASGLRVEGNITIPENISAEMFYYESHYTEVDMYIENASIVTIYSSSGSEKLDLRTTGRHLTRSYNGIEILTLQVNKPTIIHYNYTIISYKQPLLWLNIVALILSVTGYIIGTVGVIEMILFVLMRKTRRKHKR